MNSRRNQFIVLAALALILNALFNHFDSNDSSLNKTLKVGERFPVYEAQSRSGEVLNNRRFDGKPTVYFFFANWCPCSHESIPIVLRGLADLQEELAVVGIGIQDREERIGQFVKLHKVPFPVISGDAAEEIAKISGVKITPTTIFVDSDGVVRSIHVGKIENDTQMSDGLEAIIKATPVSPEGGAV